ncbi:FliI/YscN family ATPase [uncultured Litoreibacter sp.]|uniref:FliI/YscN family ATPase n=1 Tax=uncultured Litoreibacter sp. TaxID=1392394 RepID=UPI00261FDE31|nr:FliI/YscN family ATPase [uncultured Litoreibacter sp.]
MNQSFNQLISEIKKVPRVTLDGSVTSISSGIVQVCGLSKVGHIGDMVSLHPKSGPPILGEILTLGKSTVSVLAESGAERIAVNDRVSHQGPIPIMPDFSWLGRVIDPFLRPLDGRPLTNGPQEVPLKARPPEPATRKRLGARICTGIAAIDTLLPLVRGQRLGVFAGSGVGKSTLLSDLAKGAEADVVVINLIGERGRELRDFIDDTLGPEGLKRSVVVAATSDQSAMARRRAAWVGLAVAEFFREQGSHVLLLTDSVTRFAEAHREIALSSGESASLLGFPPSTTHELMSLSERAGPGGPGAGDITAIFSVLVQGSDMEGPIADTMRGVLDGHVILNREIAERGRFPAIDVSKSVSRSLPDAATEDELGILSRTRSTISTYENSKVMIKAGLYNLGADQAIDHAISTMPKIEAFLANRSLPSIEDAFSLLENCVKNSDEFEDRNRD